MSKESRKVFGNPQNSAFLWPAHTYRFLDFHSIFSVSRLARAPESHDQTRGKFESQTVPQTRSIRAAVTDVALIATANELGCATQPLRTLDKIHSTFAPGNIQ
jgi:hypothetical protein